MSVHAFIENIADKSQPSKEPDLTDFNKALDKFQKAKPNAWWKNLPVNNEMIHLLKPAQGVVVVDERNGRYLVSHRLLEATRKSFSWTKRGVDCAVALSLVQLWSWDTSRTGQCIPLPAEVWELVN